MSHDLLEDTGYRAADLDKMGCSDEIVDALRRLTKHKGESYDYSSKALTENPLHSLLEDLNKAILRFGVQEAVCYHALNIRLKFT